MRASALVQPGGAGAQTRVVRMVFFTHFLSPLYHPFLRPVKLTMLGGERGVEDLSCRLRSLERWSLWASIINLIVTLYVLYLSFRIRHLADVIVSLRSVVENQDAIIRALRAVI